MARYASCVKKGAKRSKHSKAKLQKVYNRGVGAWSSSPGSVRSRINPKKRGVPKSQRMSKQQWACARVNSFVRGSRKHDLDLR